MVTLPMTKKPAIPTQAQQSVSRASLALATDPERALHLAPNLQPDVDLLTAEGLIAFGVKGSGKSNLLALLVEQFCRFLLPQLIIDTEGEQRGLLPYSHTGSSPQPVRAQVATTSSTRGYK